MNRAKIGAVVVTHESRHAIFDCLRSLTERLPVDAPIVVVDNASTDDTRDIVLEFSPRVRLLVNRRNVGFAAANNRGAGSEGLGDTVDWILLVNPDVTLTHFDPGLFARDAESDSIGQLASLANGTIDGGAEAVRRMPSSLGPLWNYSWGLLRPAWLPQHVALAPEGTAGWASGSFCAVRRSAWEKVGGFDERFFLYHEDVDLSRRLVDAGFRIRTSHAAAARHSVGSGAQCLSDAERIAFAVSGWLTYERKWQGADHVQRLWSLFRANMAVQALALRPLERLHPTLLRKASEVRELRAIIESAVDREPISPDSPEPQTAIRTAMRPQVARNLDARTSASQSRVAFVLWEGTFGGAQRHTLALGRTLKSRGHSVGLVIIGKKGEVGEAGERMGLVVVALGNERGRTVLWHPFAFARAVRQTDPDVCVLPNTGVLTIILRCFGYRGAVLGMEHGISLNRSRLGHLQRAGDVLGRAVAARLTDCEIAVSDIAASGLRRLPHSRSLIVIRNGVDTEYFEPRESSESGGAKVTIGAACRLVTGKGVDAILLAAAALVDELRGRFLIRVAGDGPERPRLSELCRTLGLRDYVQFDGFLEDMPTFWSSVDVGVFMSHGLTESFGLSAMEALACGCRAVTSNSPATRELLLGCPGVRVLPGGDVVALGAALRDEVLLGTQRQATRRRVHEWVTNTFPIAKTALEYERVLNTFAELGTPGGGCEQPET